MAIYDKYLTESEHDNSDEHTSELMEVVFELIDSLDMDQLTEDQQDMVDEILEMYDEDPEELDEKKKERVVRGGKRTRKLKCKSGYKAVNGKCVKMSSSERRVRSKAAKKAARKRKGKTSSITRKRKRSIRRR